MNNNQHTPGPWTTSDEGGAILISAASIKDYVGEVYVYDSKGRALPSADANAARIIACVAFCEGVETEKLELGTLTSTVRHAVRLRERRDELLAALQSILSINEHSALTEEQADAIYAQARAAIAKATGEPA